ncbi:arylsulfatase [Halopseudomonas salegens]|uniref:Arylsulfatase n=1 Tax=Halopseudomonas salegens TaxID=1434072 RepID=A0A1H2FJX1_9GAMM|nr:arylsulfatase [Halopseudomonas salegens]SDU07248.1 arylsulfatase [Halopseudomonas salegens]
MTCLRTLLLAASLLASFVTQADTRPNILLILADDMGFSDPGAYGGEISTPNIDTLAAEGMQFTNFNVSATCSPTRGMLLTGVTNHKVGMGNMREIMADNQKGQPGYETWLNDQVVTLPTLLRDHGYRTYMAGKWHLGDRPQSLPGARGFEQSVTLLESGADNWEAKHYLPGGSATYLENDQPISLPDDFYSSTFFTDKLIGYLDADRERDEPFFAYLSFQAVHAPHHAPEAFIERYAGKYDQGWDEIRRQRYERMTAMGVVPRAIDSVVSSDWGTFYDAETIDWDSLDDEERRYRARQMEVYAGMAEAMDHNIGRVFAYLREQGQLDNTLVIFLSDNGGESTELVNVAPMFYRWRYNLEREQLGAPGSYSEYGPGWAYASNTPFFSYKGSPFNGGMRVPLLVRQPGQIAAGAQTNAFGYVTDITPTLLELAGIEQPDGRYQEREVHRIMGKSLLPLLHGETERIHGPEDITVYELAGGIAVWQGDYKLVVASEAINNRQGLLLFNLADDPFERNNLAASNPELTATMYQYYRDYVAANNLVEVPADYDAWQQLRSNGREQLIARHRMSLLFAGILVLSLAGALIFWLINRLRS